MARGHGRVLASSWEDDDFLNLLEGEQRMYHFLLSQPNLNHAGLLPLTLKRWARSARDLTVDTIQARLDALEAARFIVMDQDTEELLIRSFIRNDGVWRMPKVMGAAVSGAQEISSHRLRRALCAEMPRIPLDELSDAPGARGPSVREQVQEHIARLLSTVAVPDPPTPTAAPAPVAEPLTKPSDNPPATPFNTLREPFPNPSDTPAEPSTRAHAATSRAPSPALSPAPTPAPAPERERASAGSPAPTPPPRPDGRESIPDDFGLSDAMRRWATSTLPNLDPDYETQQFISHHRADGSRRKSWPDEWQKWMRRSAKYASDRAQQMQPVQGAFLMPLPGGIKPSTTDQRVAQGLAVAAQLRAEAEQEAGTA